MASLHVHVDEHTFTASWTEKNPETKTAIEDSLPIEGEATRWGDELYMRTPVDVPEEDAQREVPVGALAYWPQGNAVCLFWGPTPASTDDTPVAASPVNVVARLEDTSSLASLSGNARLRIETE